MVQWFWEVVRDDFDQEQRARLLQFTTGTSGVPAQGFAFLQGNDANIRKFTINSIPLEQSIYPRAHTCFNRCVRPPARACVCFFVFFRYCVLCPDAWPWLTLPCRSTHLNSTPTGLTCRCTDRSGT